MSLLDLATSFLIALGLAMDAFAVSIGLSTSGKMPGLRSRLRLAGHFGIFQGGMTILGWLAGETVARWIDRWDHWVAFGLLLYVGVNMIRSGLGKGEEDIHVNPSKGWSLVILSVATSLDALAVGLSFALIDAQVWIPSIMIALVTFGLSCVGLFAGHKLGEKLGKRMEIVGGLVLIGIGIRILITHLYPGL